MSTKTQNPPATASFDALGSGLHDIACGGASTAECIAFSAGGGDAGGVGVWAGPGERDGARSPESWAALGRRLFLPSGPDLHIWVALRDDPIARENPVKVTSEYPLRTFLKGRLG